MIIQMNVSVLLRLMAEEEMANGSDRTAFRLEGLRRTIETADESAYGDNYEEQATAIASEIAIATWEWREDECLNSNCCYNKALKCIEDLSTSRQCSINQDLFGRDR